MPPSWGHFGTARSFRLSFPWRSCHRHAGCLQLSHRRPPEKCGLRTRPRTDVDPPRFSDSGWPDCQRNDMPPSNCHRRGGISSRRRRRRGDTSCWTLIGERASEQPRRHLFRSRRCVVACWTRTERGKRRDGRNTEVNRSTTAAVLMSGRTGGRQRPEQPARCASPPARLL